ncbi:hydantoinase/oxoprolinase family protein [Micromonospora sp. NPDC049679]|uniref:hydantoinase/oxoprolinase family protein n=1 Tax=Micromonospora sp. NPDC049679 TaxID=3155920 RepID=UPI00340430E2
MTPLDNQTYLLGVDVGGTFTDCCLVPTTGGRMWIHKTSSTPGDPTQGILTGVREILDMAGVDPAAVTRFRHGTTVATNAILEGKGARTGLVTTAGFRDVLAIGRHDVPRDANVYTWRKPARPIPPEAVLTVAERMSVDGVPVIPLDDDEAARVVKQLAELGVDSVAICLLHAYANPAHERRLAEAISDALPHLAVSCSSDVLPVFREYERTMATCLNAYVQPSVRRYLTRLEQGLPEVGVTAPVTYMQSNGGALSRQEAERQALRMSLSGPAAGVIGARHEGASAEALDLISLDMGGTSADIGLIRGGEAQTTVEGQVGDWPMHVPMLDIITIGAGGGSIAAVAATGSVSVGPLSAGSDPGPACYARGGEHPTVTDANLVLGRLSDSIANGTVRLDVEAARRAVRTDIADPLGISVEEAAYGVIQIINNNMMGAIRQITVERGLDPRTFALMPLGGAGAVHAVELAELLGMTRVVVPPTPGVLASLGLLVAEPRNDYSRSLFQRGASLDAAACDAVYDELTEQATQWLIDEGVPREDWTITRHADLRYENQGHELTVPVAGPLSTQASREAMIAGFHERHRELYTFCFPESGVELTTLRVVARGRPHARHWTVPARPGAGAELGQREVWFADRYVSTPVFRREQLEAGWTHPGPVVFEQADSTVVVPPGWNVHRDDRGNLAIERS